MNCSHAKQEELTRSLRPRRRWRRVLPLTVAGVLLLGTAVAGAEETNVQRRERIGKMDAAQKEQLRRRCEQFDHMDA